MMFDEFLREQKYSEATIRQYGFIVAAYHKWNIENKQEENILIIKKYLNLKNKKEKGQTKSALKLYYLFLNSPIMFQMEKELND
jgi:hypothetical protein